VINRPQDDAELIECVLAILSDRSMAIDTRAMVARLVIDKQIIVCPLKADLAAMFGDDGVGDGKKIGVVRLQRMLREARRAGYLTHAQGRAESAAGRVKRYRFLIHSAVAHEAAR
jgi:hypothetical protein